MTVNMHQFMQNKIRTHILSMAKNHLSKTIHIFISMVRNHTHSKTYIWISIIKYWEPLHLFDKGNLFTWSTCEHIHQNPKGITPPIWHRESLYPVNMWNTSIKPQQRTFHLIIVIILFIHSIKWSQYINAPPQSSWRIHLPVWNSWQHATREWYEKLSTWSHKYKAHWKHIKLNQIKKSHH